MHIAGTGLAQHDLPSPVVSMCTVAYFLCSHTVPYLGPVAFCILPHAADLSNATYCQDFFLVSVLFQFQFHLSDLNEAVILIMTIFQVEVGFLNVPQGALQEKKH